MAKSRNVSRQIAAQRSLSQTIALNELTRDECELLLRLVSVWQILDSRRENKLVVERGAELSASFGSANFRRLVYKIENYISPKMLS